MTILTESSIRTLVSAKTSAFVEASQDDEHERRMKATTSGFPLRANILAVSSELSTFWPLICNMARSNATRQQQSRRNFAQAGDTAMEVSVTSSLESYDRYAADVANRQPQPAPTVAMPTADTQPASAVALAAISRYYYSKNPNWGAGAESREQVKLYSASMEACEVAHHAVNTAADFDIKH
jgi:hypothetical protein